LQTHAQEMGELVLNQLRQAMVALRTQDLILADEVIRRDHDVNQMEIATDAEIFNIIVRRCPVARDLRMLLATSKIINNLERIGDEAAKLADFARHLYADKGRLPNHCLLRDVYAMGNMAITMVQHAMTVFDELDDKKVGRITEDHRELDREFEAALRRLLTYIMEDSHHIGNGINVVLILKALERVGDHAQNIAEYVIFQVEGEDVRHSLPDFGHDLTDENPSSV